MFIWQKGNVCLSGNYSIPYGKKKLKSLFQKQLPQKLNSQGDTLLGSRGLPRAPVFPKNRTCFLKSFFKPCGCFESAGCSLALRFLLLAGSYFILGKSNGRIPPAPHTLLQSREVCPSSWDLTSLPNSSVPWTFASVSPFLFHSPDLLTHSFSLANSSPWDLVDTFLQLG